MNDARVLVVFAKQPRPGEVKTRLCPPLLPEQASALYAEMLDDVLETSARAAASAGAAAWLEGHPAEAVPALAARAPSGFAVHPQQGNDLAERMTSAVGRAAAAGFARILLRGSDSPALPAETLVEAFAGLDDADLCVGPDADGGYGWIALRGPTPGLFDHAMSTATVLEDTLTNAARAGLRTHVAEAHFDIDTADDLARLARAREAGRADCPRTLAFLDHHGLW